MTAPSSRPARPRAARDVRRAPPPGETPASRPLPDRFLETCRSIGRMLDAAREVVLTTHVNPDGDGLGAEAALAAHLGGRGVRTRILNADPPPRRFGFLSTSGAPLGVFRGWEEDGLEKADLLVVLDTGVAVRLGAVAEALPRIPERIVIDHHEPREELARVQLVDPQASSTAELVFRLLLALGAPLSPPVAVPLYVGIAFDTGFFRYSNTTSETHLAAAELSRHGVDPEEIYSRLFATHSPERMRLWGRALGSLRVEAGGRLAWMAVDRALLAETGASEEDLDGLVEQGRQVEGVRIAILFREDAPDRVKVSFRSNGPADVNRLAGRFGGGGHVKASGATVGASLAEVVPLVLAEARRALARMEAGDGAASIAVEAPADRRSVDRSGSAEAP